MKKFHEDEKEAAQMLGRQGSEACRILLKLHLDRPTIHLAQQGLQANRPAQVTLNNIICATRFKCAGQGPTRLLQPTCCQICRRNVIGSFEHLTERICMREIPEIQEFAVDYLVIMAKRALAPNPGIQVRYEEDCELCLIDYSDSSLEEISF